MDLSVRSNLPELMDAADLPLADYQDCLSDLAAVNQVTFTHGPTLAFLRNATREWPRGSQISILDLAYGHGDLLRAIGKWAERRGFEAALSGVDLNPRSRDAAIAAGGREPAIQYLTGDVFDYVPAQRPDFIVTSQFTHHLPDDAIITLLRRMEAMAVRGWHIADLHRHWFAYYGFRWLCRLFGWHRIVRYDGTISIARSFVRADWERYLRAAGIAAQITWHPWFRYCVSRLK
jgi:SAM-dependent methyltransferase